MKTPKNTSRNRSNTSTNTSVHTNSVHTSNTPPSGPTSRRISVSSLFSSLSIFLLLALLVSPAVSPALAADSFSDVKPSDWFYTWVEELYRLKLTAGCGDDGNGGKLYCPYKGVTRAEMSIFVLKAKYGWTYNPIGFWAVFADVPYGSFGSNYIENLYSQGWTAGCAVRPLRYCPEREVTRDEMAVYLIRALYGAAYAPPPATGAVFEDVEVDYWAAPYIEQLELIGMTSGCATDPKRYCPGKVISRDEMAVYVVRLKERLNNW